MTEEQKELLLKDLCARLPYGIRGKYIDKFYKEGMSFDPLVDNILISYKNPFSLLDGTIKPYLFSLSSITEEQKMELNMLRTYVSLNKNKEYLLFDWLNANHFDYRGLIDMGLAIDATNLNIY